MIVEKLHPMQKVVLLVDDDEQIRRSLERFLTPQFDIVFTASTPEEAQAILEREPVTSLICDLDLGPGLPNGLELLSRWRKEFPNIKRAVILSGSRIPAGASLESVDMVISKGADLSVLIAAL